MNRLTCRLILTGALFVVAACKDSPLVGGKVLPRDDVPSAPAPVLPAAGPDAPVVGAPVAAVSLVSPTVASMHALILPKGSDVAVVRIAVDKALASRSITVVKEPPEVPSATTVAIVETPTLAEMGVPREAFEYFGRGLEPSDLAALGEAVDVVIVSLIGPPTSVAALQHTGAALALEVARPARAWIVDVWTRETFTIDAFAAARPPEFPLDALTLTLLHAVEDDTGVFLETSGMSRFGLPELVLRRIPKAYAASMEILVGAAAQTLVERGALQRDGALVVEFAALRTTGWPETAKEITTSRGTGTITFDTSWSHGTQADVPGAPVLVELQLPGTGDVAARAYAAMSTLSDNPEQGATEAAEDDAELNGARDRARVAFAELAPRFASGIPELESLHVKAPFHTNDGSIEWMWVELESCKGEVLIGTLLNDPFSPASVKAGDRVEVKAGEIFDYRYRSADGEEQGGTTDKILMTRQQR